MYMAALVKLLASRFKYFLEADFAEKLVFLRSRCRFLFKICILEGGHVLKFVFLRSHKDEIGNDVTGNDKTGNDKTGNDETGNDKTGLDLRVDIGRHKMLAPRPDRSNGFEFKI